MARRHGAQGRSATRAGRPRRTIWALALAVLPLVIAGTSTAYADRVGTDAQGPIGATVADHSLALSPSVSAQPRAQAGAASFAPEIEVEATLEDQPEHQEGAAQGPSTRDNDPGQPGTESGSGGGGSSSGGGGNSSQSHTDFCASASANASPTTVQGLMTAVNTERARLGIAPLTWNGSLASAAQSWSESMARATSLSHNPNRPTGGENVAYASRRSLADAMTTAHRGWVASTGHCNNLMNPRFTTMGAGSAQASNGAWYSTQNFQ